MIESTFSLLADLDSLRTICPVNFLSYKPEQRFLTVSVERGHGLTVMHRNTSIIRCARTWGFAFCSGVTVTAEQENKTFTVMILE